MKYPINYNGISLGYPNTTFLDIKDNEFYSVTCTTKREFCFYQSLPTNCSTNLKNYSFKKVLESCPFNIRHNIYPYEEFLEGIIVYNATTIYQNKIKINVREPTFISTNQKFKLTNVMKEEIKLSSIYSVSSSFSSEKSDFSAEEKIALENLNKKLENRIDDNFDITWHHFFRYLIFGGISISSYNLIRLLGFLHNKYLKNIFMSVIQNCFYSIIRHNVEEQNDTMPSAPPIIRPLNPTNERRSTNRNTNQHNPNRQLARALEMQQL